MNKSFLRYRKQLMHQMSGAEAPSIPHMGFLLSKLKGKSFSKNTVEAFENKLSECGLLFVPGIFQLNDDFPGRMSSDKILTEFSTPVLFKSIFGCVFKNNLASLKHFTVIMPTIYASSPNEMLSVQDDQKILKYCANMKNKQPFYSFGLSDQVPEDISTTPYYIVANQSQFWNSAALNLLLPANHPHTLVLNINGLQLEKGILRLVGSNLPRNIGRLILVDPENSIKILDNMFLKDSIGLTKLDVSGLRSLEKVWQGFLCGCKNLESVVGFEFTNVKEFGEGVLANCPKVPLIDRQELRRIALQRSDN